MSSFLSPKTPQEIYQDLQKKIADQEAKKASKSKSSKPKSIKRVASKKDDEEGRDAQGLPARWDGKPHTWTLDDQNKLRSNPRMGAPLPLLDSESFAKVNPDMKIVDTKEEMTEVDEHLRRQAYGQDRSKRKIIIVKAHTRVYQTIEE